MNSSKGWFRIDNRLIDEGLLALIGPSAFVVYAILARHADEQGCCYPSYDRIQTHGGLSRATVARAIKTLAAVGLIRKSDESGKSNRYQFIFETGTSSFLRPPQFIFETGPVSKMNSNKTKEQDPINKKSARAPDGRLIELIDAWNSLPDGVVGRLACRFGARIGCGM